MQRAVDRSALRYHSDEGVWTYDCSGVEVAIGGGPDGPEQTRLDLAEQVVPSLGGFADEAQCYLRAFIDPTRFGGVGDWELEFVEFSRRPDDPADGFELLFHLEGDQYGLWGVRFGFSGPPLDRFFPLEFRRRQW
jgi:hypothetical protein